MMSYKMLVGGSIALFVPLGIFDVRGVCLCLKGGLKAVWRGLSLFTRLSTRGISK